MTQFQFSVDLEELKDALMNSNLETVMKSTMVMILNEVMEQERDDYLQANAYERTSTRTDYRNGYYDREYTIRLGKLKLRVPRTRFGDFSTQVFERYSRAEQAFTMSLLEMFVNGVSTRKVSSIVETLCGEKVSKSLVSSLTSRLDPIIEEWANRPLGHLVLPHVFVDAMYIKVREEKAVVSKALYIATALDAEGYRHVLGHCISDRESTDGWTEFFESLQERGLNKPVMVTSDAHKGLVRAIQETFVGTAWQRCLVHFKRNIMNKMPKKNGETARKEIKRIFEEETMDSARQMKEDFLVKYGDQKGYRGVCETLDDGFEDAIQFLSVEDPKLRVHIRSTNSLERLNEEMRRREKVLRIFPHTQSAYRLFGALLMDYDELLQKKRHKYLL